MRNSLRDSPPLVQCRRGCHCIWGGCRVFCCHSAFGFFFFPSFSLPSLPPSLCPHCITQFNAACAARGTAWLQRENCPYLLTRQPLNPTAVLLRQIKDFTAFGIIWFYLVPHMTVTFNVFARISLILINYGMYVWVGELKLNLCCLPNKLNTKTFICKSVIYLCRCLLTGKSCSPFTYSSLRPPSSSIHH